MEELLEEIDDLKKALDETSVIKELKEYNKKIQNEKDLLEKINKYQLTMNERIKEEIINNILFREYKKKETNVNLLIMDINQRLKKINPKGRECK